MRHLFPAFLLPMSCTAPALAGNIHRSPVFGHKVGAACAPGHHRMNGSPTGRMAGCLRGRG